MTDVTGGTRCANCDEPLGGAYCSRCGQHAAQWHRPFRQLAADLADEVFSLDTRLTRTIGPLFFRPGRVTRDYLAGRRARYVPPVRTYLIAALVFFGLFTLLTSGTPVAVFMSGSPEAEALRNQGGARTAFELPGRSAIFDAWYQEASARALANPEEFAGRVYANVPRAFFLFLPIFALLLELFYREEGYYIDHLVFSLYYHAFVFLDLSLLFVTTGGGSFLPAVVRRPLALVLVVWLLAYLPIALRHVYGGSNVKTFLKVMGLGILYFAVYVLIGLPLVVGAALAVMS